MDTQTHAAYDGDPAHYCRFWLEQASPDEIYSSVRAHFIKGGATADIGAGSGRDVDWLNRHGYPCTGFDASDGLLAEASRLFPAYKFQHAVLPDLAGIPDAAFDNVLCETVLMHLSAFEQGPALAGLLRILRPGGVLRVSWRGETSGRRDPAGRLYEAVAIDALLPALPVVTVVDRGVSTGVSGVQIAYIVLVKAQ